MAMRLEELIRFRLDKSGGEMRNVNKILGCFLF